MKFAVNLPLDHIHPEGEFQTPDAVREIAVALDRSWATACYLTDHPAPEAHWLHNTPGGHDALDPFTGLAFIASQTSRVKLLSNIVVLPYRNPFITAKAAATLQILSGGRFIFGVGIGYQKVEFEALGVPHNERGARSDEALEAIRLAWAGGEVVKRGRFFDAASNEPRPVPSPPPPIWIGGGSDRAAERAARWGDGWMPVYFPAVESNRVTSGAAVFSLAELGGKIEKVKGLREKLGKTGPFDFVSSTPILGKARAQATTGEYLDAIGKIAALGVTGLNFGLPSTSRSAWLENLAWLSEEIIPAFAEAG